MECRPPDLLSQRKRHVGAIFERPRAILRPSEVVSVPIHCRHQLTEATFVELQ